MTFLQAEKQQARNCIFKNIGNTFHFRAKRAKGCFETRLLRAGTVPPTKGGAE